MTEPQFEELTDEEHELLILMSEHAIAPPLSDTARSVFESFNSKFEWVEDGIPGPQFKAIAAAFRAAADEWRVDTAKMTQTDFICGMLFAAQLLEHIADELESQ